MPNSPPRPTPRRHAPGRPASHILTYAQDLSGGGVERAQLRLAREWMAAGRRVTLVAGDLTGPLSIELPPGIETVMVRSRSYAALFALPDIVRRLKPDVIFCAGNFYTLVAAWTRLRLGDDCPPIVGKLSNAIDRGDNGILFDIAHRAWLAMNGSFLDHLVAMTPATGEQAERAMRMKGRVSVLPNPPAVPVADSPNPPLPPGRFILGVGRLAPQKRWDRLIAAIPRIADREVKLLILGEGSARGALEAQIRALGLVDRVLLLGHSLDPVPAMARAVVMALTSDYEGVPGVLREALSVGTPVVSTDASLAVAEIIASPALGDIVDRDSADDLVAALDRWLVPGVVRPDPVAQTGADSSARYLALFDRMTARG